MAKDTGVFFDIRLPAKITKRKKWYVASCPVLDVHSQGETEQKARDNLTEAVLLFFVSCLERKTLDAVLKECGFRVGYPPRPRKKRTLVSREDYINVPVPLLVSSTRHKACHA